MSHLTRRSLIRGAAGMTGVLTLGSLAACRTDGAVTPVVVLDDWVDGTGRTPGDVLTSLRSSSGSDGMGGVDHGSMSGMDHGSMGGMGGITGEGMQSRLLGGAGDVDFPHYLVNGRTLDAPVTLTGKPGQRVKIRFVNASSDTVHGHTFALAGSGVRKDTVVVRPMQMFEVDLDADNPLAAHCHNVYHAEAGMMTTLSYRV